MELRQLEFFVTSVEEKSFYKAGQKLFTSQSAVSKSVSLLEKELKIKLLERTNKGLKLTSVGSDFYNYAQNILQQVKLMKNLTIEKTKEQLRISSYPSYFIANILADYYNVCDESIKINYQEGTVQNIIELVVSGVSDIGIIYISPHQEPILNHILGHSNLEFIHLNEQELCIHMGKNHKCYDSSVDHLSVEELSNLKYIRGTSDFFSIEHHFDFVNLNILDTAHFDDVILTNSDHLVSAVLEKTDVCHLGIDTNMKGFHYKKISNSEEKRLILGYIKNVNTDLNEIAAGFLCYLKEKL